MKIKQIKARVLQFPIYLPMIDQPTEHRVLVFCEVETDDGLTGFGVTGAMLPWATVTAIEHEVFPVVKDMDPRDTEAIHNAVWWKINPRAGTGVVSYALSAIDIACWDIRGKYEGRTVAQLLGGYRDFAPTYITFGYPIFDHDQLVEYAKKFIADGHTRLKMVVGVDKGGWREDAKRIHTVREAVGDDVDLMIDANFRFVPNEALMLCRAVEDCNLTWFEEPVHQNDARVLADLRSRTNIPIAAGQMEGHRWRLRELITHHAVDILQPNCAYCGGYTEVQKAAHMAQAYNLPIDNGGGWPMFNMHAMAGLLNGGWVEFHWGFWQAGQKIFDGTPSPQNNRVEIPKAPGLGFTPKVDAIDEYTVKRPEDLKQHGMRSNMGGIIRL